MKSHLILASSSKYRRQQLASIGIKTDAIAPNIDETPFSNELPEQLALRLAKQKAEFVAQQHPNALVIGSDQVACVNLNGHPSIMGKPGGYENAKQQLIQCSGKSVEFYTAVSVQQAGVNKALTSVEKTTVSFRALSEDQIRQYLLAETPYDCAGSFKSEGLGILLFDSITSRDPNALIGLPLMLLRDLLAEFDVDLLTLASQQLRN